MKTTQIRTFQPISQPTGQPADQPISNLLTPTCPLPQTPLTTAPGEAIKHILVGSPGAIRQTIHLLHTLHYTETLLWSPVLRIEEPLVITPQQGEAMSLLRKLV